MNLRIVAGAFTTEPVETIIFFILLSAAVIAAVVAVLVGINAFREAVRERRGQTMAGLRPPPSLRRRYL
jgi:hypothetical protein